MKTRRGPWAMAWATGVLASALVATAASALPPGRAWTPLDTLLVPGHTRLLPDRIDTDPSGALLLFAAAVGGIGRDTYGLRWADSLWVPTWNLGYGTIFIQPVVSPPGTYPLIWKGMPFETPQGSKNHIIVAEALGNSVTPPETLGATYAGSFSYSAAASPRRRWAAASDIGKLWLWYSDTARVWHEVEIQGFEQGDNGVGVTTLDDTTALVAFASGYEGLRWGVLRGSQWSDGEPRLLDPSQLSGGPQFRTRPSGGHWLVWTTNEDYTLISTFRNGLWSPPETLRCDWRRPYGQYGQPAYLSHDPSEYPAVAWSANDAQTAVATLCVCVPNDSGFTLAENLDNTDEGLAVIARDLNGDVWVAWWHYFNVTGMFWTHSYTRATTSRPLLQTTGNDRVLSWFLTEPAPESWWAVLRADRSEPFQMVGRVRAGPTLDMTWTDHSPPEGYLRYKIRRESADTRYRWESEEVDTPTAALWSLIDGKAEPDVVRLRWYAGEYRGHITVSRSRAGDPWETIADVTPNGLGRVEIEDHEVESGHRYGYHLTVSVDGREEHHGETWVDVPDSFRLALEGARPNPTSQDLSIGFSLPANRKATIEILDITGRRTLVRHVGSYERGNHAVRMDHSSDLPAGLYLIRLTVGNERLTKKVAVFDR